MVHKIFTKVTNNWGLILILFILILVILPSIKPDFFIMGWDNFSTALDVKLNLNRTLFATWREYRGMGVPSDSEVTDIFRQIFYLLLSPFMLSSLADQIYIFLTLSLGLIGIYFLSKKIIETLKIHAVPLEVGATIAALFYLFNLNTLATFFYPMPMFTTRFALLPWLTLIFIKIIQEKNISLKSLVLLIIITLLGSASYLTATIFITVMIILFTIGLTIPKKLPLTAIIITIFLLLNAYWLLPFTNYTLNRSSSISHTSTFVEVNEIQLNEDPMHLTWEKILTMYPNFFYTKATDPKSQSPINLHPKVDDFSEKSSQMALILFPILTALGVLVIILNFKNKYVRWIPFVILISLFMLRKNYTPFGFIFDAISDHIPLFEVVFRFADTKFYALFAFAGSISIGILAAFIIRVLPKFINIAVALACIVIILNSYSQVFSSYFDGNLISGLMYNKIPNAYYEIADTINKDPEYGRVLHLPTESISYWKPYSWGYVGSSFLAFMLDKPLLDRTFAPGSQENDQADLAILKLTENIDSISNESDIEKRAVQFSHLLYNSNVKYLIFDETVTPEVSSRNTTYWGSFATSETKKLINVLENQDIIKPIKTYQVTTPENNKIFFYKVNASKYINESVIAVDESHENLQKPVFLTDNKFIQNHNSGILYPLILNDLKYIEGDKSYTSTLEMHSDNSLSFDSIPTKQAYGIYAGKNDESLIIGVQPKNNPLIDEEMIPSIYIPLKDLPQITMDDGKFLSDWHILKYQFSNLRLSLGNIVIPLPYDLNPQAKYIATILTEENPVNLRVLNKTESVNLPLENFQPTDNPNCFEDKHEGYDYKLTAIPGLLELTSTNGSSCITSPSGLKSDDQDFIEVKLTYSLKSRSLEDNDNYTSPSSIQTTVNDIVSTLPTANYFNFCLVEPVGGGCYNNHQAVKEKLSGEISIPSNTLLAKTPQIFISLPTIGKETTELTVKKVDLTLFKTVYEQNLELPLNYEDKKLEQQNDITITIPKILSKNSYYFNPLEDVFKVYNKPCENPSDLRATKKYQEETLQYTHGCQTGAYIDLPFNSDNFYFWTVEYNLASGKYPKFILKDDKTSFKDEYLSLYTGYPTITGFKSLQVGEPLFGISSLESYVVNTLDNAQFYNSHTFIYPQQGVVTDSPKLFTIFQQSDNVGLTIIKNMAVTELPAIWSTMVLKPDITTVNYNIGQNITTKKILPSLWKITLSPSNETNKNYLIEFDQAYDDQWKIYTTGSSLGAILGFGKINAEHIKINGLTNGWIVPEEIIKNNNEFYVLYNPERYAIVGWIVTILTILLVGVGVSYRKAKREQV